LWGSKDSLFLKDEPLRFENLIPDCLYMAIEDAGLNPKDLPRRTGVFVGLTAYEYKMLEYLMLHPGQVISKSELTEHLYAQDYDRDSNVLEVFVRRLRQKLDPDQTLKPIETVRGQGYRFNLGTL